MLCQELLEKKYPEFQVQCILGSNGVAITITHLGTFRNKCRVRHSMPVLCASLVYMYRLYSDDFHLKGRPTDVVKCFEIQAMIG